MLRQLMMAGAAGGDPYWASVTALLNFGGPNGSTTFTDSKGLVAWAANGDAHVETSLGYSVGVFDGVNDYLHSNGTGVPSFLQLGGGDFTIDFIVKTNNTSVQAICGNLQDQNGTGHYWVILNSTYTGLHTVQFGIQGGTFKFGTAALDTTAEHHIELSRIGTSLRCFLDGAPLGTTQTLNNFTGTTSAPDFWIGCQNKSGVPVYALNGHMRAFRVTKGAGRHASNFTPPAAPFPEF